MQDRQLIVLGRLGTPWGVRGWVKVNSYTEPREAILDYRDIYLRSEGEWRPLRIAEGRMQGKSPIVRLAGISDRDAALQYRDSDIGMPREQMPELDAGHYYWSDLEGLTVKRRDGEEIGRVAYMLATGEHDVMVVRGKRETLIPFVLEKFVLDVDLANRLIVVDWEWD
ncbi:MAG: ribosome maturation factor RimM [Gammaproteobacteria bacterium]|nr:ribosome maturation factor RimM [Gammaproteobacteria bacterium]